MTETGFTCALCGKTAATVIVAHPEKDLDALQLDSGDVATLVIADFWGRQQIGVAEEDLPRLRRALEQGNAQALYALDPLWAPFYCPNCDRSYCNNHWRVELRFDDDFPGWYDCAYGTCPEGHRRLIDD